MGYDSGAAPFDTGVYVANFTVADAVLSLTVGPSYMDGRCSNAILNYRAETTDAASGGWQPGAYHVDLMGDWSGSRDVVLRYGRDILAAGDVADRRVPTDSHRVRVAFAGDRHAVWVDERQVIDYWAIEAGRKGAGYLGFGGCYSIGGFDDFKVSEAKPGVARPPVNASGMGPLVFQGRPFFVIGTYNPPDDEDLKEWLGAGCNTAVLNPPVSAAERAVGSKQRASWPKRHGVAAIYFPTVDFYSRQEGKPTLTRPEDIPAKAARLKQMLALTADDPQTLGYCTFDEPENELYPAYQEWDQKKDQGLAQWIAGGMRWTFDTLKAGDPDAYVMPIVAWWTTYKDMAPLYDVNMPNQYPTLHSDAPLQGPLYEVVMDAALAADAARAARRVGFVYMPGIFDTMPGRWRAATRRELRYLCFAPVTQGALGVLPWRLGYCSMPYRRAVVYPIMRELSHLRPWFLGEWCDGKVTSDRDTATVDYLRKLPRRVRMVEGEEKAETVETDAVPDCSHCLRRRPDNTYLLLAVNNRTETVQATFTLKDINDLPETALDQIEYARVPIANGQIKDTLEPFAVRAYRIEPK
ncbi:MAG: hypothetical protein HY318_17755 [Armatimonadetes bacterium]|nr:hypothetical protein [Armatimonadota bacterium]